MASTNDDYPVSARVGAHGMATEIIAAGHRLIADEAPSEGGTAQGPTPHDFLLAALGSCTAMTLRVYADRKGMPLQGVEVKLRRKRVRAEDCPDCATKTGQVTIIERVIELTGTLDADQRQRLLQIADHCPVHRALTREIKIRTSLGVA